jgi:hypothetical protein
MYREPNSFGLLGMIITLRGKCAGNAHVKFSLELTAKSLLNLTWQFTQHVFLEYYLYEGQGQVYLCQQTCVWSTEKRR